MNAVDTNVLVRLLTRDDPGQTQRAELFVAKGAWVSHLVLAETVWVLESVYDLNRKAVGIAVGMLLNHAQISLQEADVVTSALQLFERHAGVGFSDCLILAIANHSGHTPLGTFDRKLGKVAGAECL